MRYDRGGCAGHFVDLVDDHRRSPVTTKSWGRRIAFPIAVLATLAALCVPATATLQLLQPDPAVPATFVGRGGVSTDGLGQVGGGGTIQAEVPAGSTVVQAYLYGAYTYNADNPSEADRTISIDGTNNVLTTLPGGVPDPTTPMATARADITAQVAAKVGSGGGITNFTVDNDPASLEGVALVVIYSNPSLPVTTIAVLDGESLFAGDSFTFNFSTPLEVDRPGFSATLAVGSGFSYQVVDGHACAGSQSSLIDVNAQRVSSCAGNYDDGVGANGALITVGGVGDSTDNPEDPMATNTGTDDELYNLVPFLKNGDPSITVATTNASQDDNLFLAVLKVTQETGAQKVVPVAQPDSVTAVSGQPTGIDVLANDTDPDHLLVPSTVSIATEPSHGTAGPNGNGSGEVIYTSVAGYTGTDSFVYQVCGVDQTLCTIATVTVNVTNGAAEAVETTAAFTG
jgi:hypothetical protein